MKKYIISFYTLEDLAEETCSYEIEASNHDISLIDTSIDNFKEHNYLHFNGVFIDLSKFAVIEYEEQE